MPEQAQPPVCLGRPMGRPARVAFDLDQRLAQPDWVLILTDIRAEVRVWDDGRWEWLHSSGTREDGGKAEGPATAAARAQEAILRRARITSDMVAGMTKSETVVDLGGHVIGHTEPRPYLRPAKPSNGGKR